MKSIPVSIPKEGNPREEGRVDLDENIFTILISKFSIFF